MLTCTTGEVQKLNFSAQAPQVLTETYHKKSSEDWQKDYLNKLNILQYSYFPLNPLYNNTL